VKRVAAKGAGGAPHEVMLVLDAKQRPETLAQGRLDDALGLRD